MSATSERGKSFELKVAKMLRLKGDKHAQRNKGSHANWHRRSDIFTNLPVHIEAKDHETLKPKEWFRQAEEAAFGKTPVVAFQMDAEVMVMLKFDDLLNFFVEIADQKLEIEDLRRPVMQGGVIKQSDVDAEANHPIHPPAHEIKLTDGNLKREVKLCKGGHICTPGRDSCMTKGCVYSSTYIKPKATKEKK